MPPKASTTRLDIELPPLRDFADEFRALTLVDSLARRPDYGKAGTKIDLVANIYPLTFKKPIVAHQYDIAIVAVPRVGKPKATGARAIDAERQLPLKLCRQIYNNLGALNPELNPVLAKSAYDGRKSVFTPVLFPFGEGSQTYEVQLQPNTDNDTAPRAFTVKISFAQKIDLSVLSNYVRDQSLAEQVAIPIQAIDVLLRHDPSNRSNVIIAGAGRKFLNSANGTPLSSGAQLLKGFFQSVRPTSLGPVINLDVAASPYLQSGNLLRVCNMIVGRDGGGGGGGGGRGGRGGGRGGRGGGRGGGQGGGGGHPAGAFNEGELRELKSKLRGGRVRVTHRVDRKEYIIDSFGQISSQQVVSIADRSGPRRAPGVSAIAAAQAAAESRAIDLERPEAPEVRMTVDQYFKNKYNVATPNPSYQVIRLKNGTYVPIECLELLPGVSIPPTRLSGDQAAEMIRLTATRPEDRKKAIDIVRVENDFNRNARLQSWDITVSPDMAKLVGRTLAPPKVTYKAGPGATPSVYSGSWNLTQAKFLGPNKPLQYWSVINFAPRMIALPQLQGFLTTLVGQCISRGMSIPNKFPPIMDGNPQDILGAIKLAARAVMDPQAGPAKVPPQLMVFVIQDPKLYPDLKRIATMSFPKPIVTQVLLAKNLVKERGVDQYCGNVSLKLNAKLFGYNSNVTPADTPKLTTKTIMIGADVTHPPATRGSDVPAPSISALVATKDSTNTTYECQVREQEGRKEMITDLESMASILLKKWIANSKNVKPDVILFFRDGVSEGQYATVVFDEISSLKAAIKAIDPKWTPKISYIVCAKRHNIRFFATGQTKVDKTGNLPAGTVVDTTVVNPYLFDFYLQAHAGLVGTARPTHYVVLLDENGFNADQMQKLVNSLCYTFARATKSVSLVPVAYYADIVATAARSFGSYDDDTSSIASGAAQLDPMRIQRALDKFGASAPMWFM